jgi:hypothetical protein
MTRCIIQQHSGEDYLYFVRSQAELATNFKKEHRPLLGLAGGRLFIAHARNILTISNCICGLPSRRLVCRHGATRRHRLGTPAHRPPDLGMKAIDIAHLLTSTTCYELGQQIGEENSSEGNHGVGLNMAEPKWPGGPCRPAGEKTPPTATLLIKTLLVHPS